MAVELISEECIRITKTVSKEVATVYNYSDLLKRKATIIAQQKRDDEIRKKELEEVNALIAECEKAGIKPAIKEAA